MVHISGYTVIHQDNHGVAEPPAVTLLPGDETVVRQN